MEALMAYGVWCKDGDDIPEDKDSEVIGLEWLEVGRVDSGEWIIAIESAIVTADWSEAVKIDVLPIIDEDALSALKACCDDYGISHDSVGWHLFCYYG